MKNDMELIVHKFGTELDGITVYPMGDLHIGSPEMNWEIFDCWLEQVGNDPTGYMVLLGDIFDNALKGSKTNSYESSLRIRDAKDKLERKLRPITEKILAAIPGNHEYRSIMASDSCPLYDVMARLRLEDLYRENMAFIKILVGQRTVDRQCSYTLTLVHGGSKTKANHFGYAIDGLDVLVTAHTHEPLSRFPSKIVIDSHNGVVRQVGFAHVVVPSLLSYGGYVARTMYAPQDYTKFPRILLSGKTKEVSVLWK